MARNSRPLIDRSKTTRRRILSGSGAAMVAGLSGCLGDDEEDDIDDLIGDEDVDDVPDVDPEEGVITSLQGRLPSEIQFNPWAIHYPPTFANWTYDEGAKTYLGGRVEMMGIDDFHYDPDTPSVDVILRDDIVFWNGDQYTSRDLWTYDEFSRQLAPEASEYESIEMIDDLTVRYSLKEQRNPSIIERADLHNQLERHHETWEPWLEQLEDADTQEEIDQLEVDLTEFTIPLEEFVDRGLGTSAMYIESNDDWTDTDVFFQPNPHHRAYDDIELEGLRLIVAEGAAADQLIVNGDIDFGEGTFDPRHEGAAPERLQNVNQYPGMWMWHMQITHDHTEALGNVWVRRAMAAVIDTTLVTSHKEKGFPIDVWTGMDTESTEEFAGDLMDDFIDYKPQESDWDLADEFLEQGGYTREDGTIYGPDDEEIEEIDCIAQEGEVYFIPMESAYEQLSAYGFPIDFTVMDRDLAIERYSGDADFGLTNESHYAGATMHPIMYFRPYHIFGYYLADAETEDDVSSWLDDGLEYSPFNGKPLRPEIPVEVGRRDLDGDTKEVNVWDAYHEVRSTADPDRERELMRDLAVMYNFHLPSISLMLREEGQWGNTEDYSWPEPEVMQTYRGGFLAIKHGHVNPV